MQVGNERRSLVPFSREIDASHLSVNRERRLLDDLYHVWLACGVAFELPEDCRDDGGQVGLGWRLNDLHCRKIGLTR